MSVDHGLTIVTKVVVGIAIVLAIVRFAVFSPGLFTVVFAVALVWALTGLSSQSLWRRQLGAIGIAALVWIPFWLVAGILLFAFLLGASDGGDEVGPFHFLPSVVVLVVGLVVAVRVGLRSWPRAQALEP